LTHLGQHNAASQLHRIRCRRRGGRDGAICTEAKEPPSMNESTPHTRLFRLTPAWPATPGGPSLCGENTRVGDTSNTNMNIHPATTVEFKNGGVRAIVSTPRTKGIAIINRSSGVPCIPQGDTQSPPQVSASLFRQDHHILIETHRESGLTEDLQHQGKNRR
jgi:hypothetical protein